MGTMVVFPFKTERPEVVLRNIRVAAAHEAVSEVLCVGYEEESTYRAIADASPGIAKAARTPVTLRLQDRIGTRRPGKGDGMNTALRHFLDTPHDRLHFYDSDITTFDGSWITKAERGLDLGYDVVRHFFPRAATDAMITWLVTRTGFAILFPRSELPWIEQPLGGELALSRRAAKALAADHRVAERSDWGIDTMLAFSSVQDRMSILEVYVPQGKAHKLYGQLTDLKRMLVECFAAVRDLREETLEPGIVHHVEYPDVVPPSIAEKVGYDVEGTMQLLPEAWSERQMELLEYFPIPIRDGMVAARHRTTFSFLDECSWYDAFEVLLQHFDEADEDWADLLFHLWTVRVLAYTHEAALRGYSYALRYLHGMVFRYLYRAATGRVLRPGE